MAKDKKKIIPVLTEDPAERQRVFKCLCKHIEAGFSLESFPEVSNSYFKLILEKYKNEFDFEELELAKAKGRYNWELLGLQQSNGTCLGNSRSWFYNMANRYGWSDRSKVETDVKGNVTIEVVNYSSKKSE